MQFPFSLYPLALGYPFGDFGDHQRAKQYLTLSPRKSSSLFCAAISQPEISITKSRN